MNHRRSVLAFALFAVALLAGSPLASQQRVPTGELVDDLPASVDPTAHYTLFVPREYDAARSWPVLLIFDPRGRARQAAEIFQPAAERFGWLLLSSNDSRSDGPWAPNEKAVGALWTEIERFAVDRSRIYATGFSGGAIVSWVLAQNSQQIAGVIAVGGRPIPELSTADIRFVHFGAAGNLDFNYGAMKSIDELVEKRGVPHRLEIFDGPHSWFDATLAEEAVGWMELQAMRRQLRPRDAALVEELWQADFERAGSLLAAGDELAAQRRFAQIATTFEGLRDITPARREAERLAEESSFKKALREERRWDAVDDRYSRETLPRLRRLRPEGDRPTLSELIDMLEIRRLKRQADGDGYAAVVAQRMLHRVFTQTSFYVFRDLMGVGAYSSARISLEIAVLVNDSRPFTWYNLACAAARSGAERRAIEALTQAIERGFSSLEQLDADTDLDSLRELESFAELRQRLGGPEASADGVSPPDEGLDGTR